MDATQALIVVIIAVIFRDGLLGWALIKWVIRVSTPAVPVVPVPGPGTTPDPGIPPVIVTPPPPTPPAVPLQSGKGSWYSQYQGKYSWVDDGDTPGSNALRVPDSDQGVSFYNEATLGKWFEVHAPNGVVSIERQTDVGPNPKTGRLIDISAAAAEKRFGYSPQSFPTDGIFQWRPANAPGAATPSPVPTGATPPWLTLARSLVGVNENDDPSRIVGWSKAIAAKFPDMAAYATQYTSASIPWCGQFVAYVLSQSGIRPVFGPPDDEHKYLWAFAWKDWGTDASANPQPGDVLVFKWSNGGGHVTMYDHEVDDNYYHCTGGNQGSPGQVSTEKMPMSACVAIRRPPSA